MADRISRAMLERKTQELAGMLNIPYARCMGEEGLLLEPGTGSMFRLTLTKEGRESQPFGSAYFVGNEATYRALDALVSMVHFLGAFNPPAVDTIKTRDRAREFAIDWQARQARQSISWGELAGWQAFFQALAERFDLEAEFQENGIL